MEASLAAAEPTGVTFAVENHSHTTNDPAFLTALLDGVGSKRLGLTLDIGNFYWFGHPLGKVYELCETFAPPHFPHALQETSAIRRRGDQDTRQGSPISEAGENQGLG